MYHSIMVFIERWWSINNTIINRLVMGHSIIKRWSCYTGEMEMHGNNHLGHVQVEMRS